MMNRLFFTLVVLSTIIGFVNCQNKNDARQAGSVSFHDDALGITFTKVGAIEKVEEATYRITLPASNNSSVHTVFAQVSVSEKLFVDLPGSYGGKFFFDAPSASEYFQNRVLTDSVNTGGLNFRREYWIVYAGMGMWEGVINCYTQKGNGYCLVSLVQELSIGKPGEDVDGKQLAAEDLKGKVLTSLQDTTNGNVNTFTTLLTSVQIQK